jgi:hypothetical protein
MTLSCALNHLQESLKEVRRHLIYCQGMKLKQAELQFKHWQQHLSIERSDIVVQQATAGLFRPAHLIVRDRTLRQVGCCSLQSRLVQPHKMPASAGAVDGAHSQNKGMLYSPSAG